jgi:hypothetical protein
VSSALSTCHQFPRTWHPERSEGPLQSDGATTGFANNPYS